MKRFLIILLSLFSVFNINAQISAVSTTSVAVGAIGGTTSNITTTGADLIVIGLTYYQSTGRNISDNKGNTWTFVRQEEAGSGAYAACAVYYCSNPTVGTGHNFSTTSHFANIFVLAVSGSRTATTPLDQQNGANTASSGSIASGNVTPTVANCLSFVVYGGFNPGASPTITSGGSGYTNIGAYGTSTSEAGRADYKVLSGTPTENLTINSSSSPHGTIVLVDFMPPTTTPAYNSGFFFIGR